jgi:hypothetical protein
MLDLPADIGVRHRWDQVSHVIPGFFGSGIVRVDPAKMEKLRQFAVWVAE